MNIQELKQALPVLFKLGYTPLIHGHRGVGKSQSISQYCKEQGIGFIDLRLGQMADAGDLLGLPQLNDDTQETTYYKPSYFPTEGRGIIFLDEINRASKDITQGIFQLVLDGKIHEYKLPKGWNVVGALNPPTEDYNVTDFDDSAYHDRFCHIKLEPTVVEWASYIDKKYPSNLSTSFLVENTEFLEPKLQDFDLPAKGSRRTWETAIRLYEQVMPEFELKDNIRDELLMGLVGVEGAISYITYMKSSKDSLVNVVDILENFEGVKEKFDKMITDNRHDMLMKICSNMYEVLKEKEELSDDESINLSKYLLAMPKENTSAFVKRCVKDNIKCIFSLFKMETQVGKDIYKYFQEIETIK